MFTPLEYGACGMSEEDAIAKFGKENIEVYQANFTPLETSVAHRLDNECFTKLICNKKDQVCFFVRNVFYFLNFSLPLRYEKCSRNVLNYQLFRVSTLSGMSWMVRKFKKKAKKSGICQEKLVILSSVNKCWRNVVKEKCNVK